MRVGIAWGTHQSELDVHEKNLVHARRATTPAALTDPVPAMRDALEHPFQYPALRLALTPDDHIVVVVDERIPRLSGLLIALLEHIHQAGVQPDAITLLCLPPALGGSGGQAWLDDLPDVFQDVRIEVHDPGDRRRLAYLATTKQGRRVYLNRSAVDADQLVLLTRRGYDPLLGYLGAETALFPALCDTATIHELAPQRDHLFGATGGKPTPIQEEAKEISWLLGAPFYVHIIEGYGDAIDTILAGSLASSGEAERLLNARWRVAVEQPVDVVLASVSGDPTRQTIDDLARAFFAASAVVQPGGAIVLLTEVAPSLSRSFEIFRQHDNPDDVMSLLHEERPNDLATGLMWAVAANQARLYLLSGLSADISEELFTIPLQNPLQAQKLLTEHATCLFLPDAHKTLAVIQE